MSGELPSFSFAWYFFWINKPGSLAIISTVFGNYVIKLFIGLSNDDDTTEKQWEAKGLAIALIIVSTVLNFMGVKESTLIVNFLTVLKILLIVLVAAVGIYYSTQHSNTIS